MNPNHIDKIAAELGIKPHQVMATAKLIEEGATVPFIARYRKEQTELLDEVAITAIRDRMAQLDELDKRRDSILKSLEERQLLSEELNNNILAAETMAALEDLYLPYRPKRRTRATIAKEKGLEPLAHWLFEQTSAEDPGVHAMAYVDIEKGVNDTGEALSGARDIIAEWVNESSDARAKMRALYLSKALFRSKLVEGKETEAAKFRDYFDWEEPAATAPSHRILALRRGEKETCLDLRVIIPQDEAYALLESMFVKGNGPLNEQVRLAVQDGYDRLLSGAMTTELRLATKERADHEAIKVFADNLRELLLAPPLGQKRVLAIDPGLRTGCKIACLDSQGKLLATATIYPFQSENARLAAAQTLASMCKEHSADAIAIGNGTAGRETESFVKGLKGSLLPSEIITVVVSESGASVYSASDIARQEFPDLDLTYRGSVSIGRRLLDPLAELVKIDPKSIGVGQYQHDVDQGALKTGLDDIVISCVNAVGVELNTASEPLLTYVSGLGPQLAKNIVVYRNSNGPFSSREELKKVPRLGPKAFEQAAGFLRIREGKNPLDSSAVHPEAYRIVHAMADDLGCTINDMLSSEPLRKQIDLTKYVTDTVGMPTLIDILAELAKPGRDPRSQFEMFSFSESVDKIEDLKPDMRLPGVVTNVTAFGAFVDIGVHQDGLVHLSQLADRFVKDPRDVVKVHQKVMVSVLEVDIERKRISLSMKQGATKEDQAHGQKQTERAPQKKVEQRTGVPDHPNHTRGNKNKDRAQQNSRQTAKQPINNPFVEALKNHR